MLCLLYVLALLFLCLQQKLETRGGRILALVPAHNAPSDDSEPSDIEDEIRVHAPLSMASSSAPSIESSLERLNLLNDEQEPTNDNVRLTPIFQTVYSSPSLEPNCNKVPILSDIPSFPATPASPVTPATPSATASLLARSASVGLETPRTPANVSSTSRFSRRTRSQRPTISVAQRPRRIQKFTLSYRWKKAVFRHLASVEEESDPIGDATIQTPLEYFYKIFSPDILTHILEQSNAYAVSKTGRTLGLSEDELRDFIAIHIIMGVVSMPSSSYTDYWSLRYRHKLVANLMPLKRYQQIRRYLHFVDNNIEDSDRYYKIRPLVQKNKGKLFSSRK